MRTRTSSQTSDSAARACTMARRFTVSASRRRSRVASDSTASMVGATSSRGPSAQAGVIRCVCSVWRSRFVRQPQIAEVGRTRGASGWRNGVGRVSRFGPNTSCGDTPQQHLIHYPFTSYAGDVTFTQLHPGNRTVDFDTEGNAPHRTSPGTHRGRAPRRRDRRRPRAAVSVGRSVRSHVGAGRGARRGATAPTCRLPVGADRGFATLDSRPWLPRWPGSTRSSPGPWVPLKRRHVYRSSEPSMHVTPAGR